MPSAAPDGIRTNAFRTIVARLVNHTSLGCVKSWRTWEGKPTDDDEPAKGNVPWIRMTPLAMPATRKALHGGVRGALTPNTLPTLYASPFRINFEVVVNGPRVDGLANLWERIEAALWPTNATERIAWEAKLATFGIRDLKLIQPAWPTSTANVSAELIVGDGAIEVDLYLTL